MSHWCLFYVWFSAPCHWRHVSTSGLGQRPGGICRRCGLQECHTQPSTFHSQWVCVISVCFTQHPSTMAGFTLQIASAHVGCFECKQTFSAAVNVDIRHGSPIKVGHEDLLLERVSACDASCIQLLQRKSSLYLSIYFTVASLNWTSWPASQPVDTTSSLWLWQETAGWLLTTLRWGDARLSPNSPEFPSMHFCWFQRKRAATVIAASFRLVVTVLMAGMSDTLPCFKFVFWLSSLLAQSEGVHRGGRHQHGPLCGG